MTFITEAGLFKVILRSDKPNAKPFQRWVCHDVLPCTADVAEHGLRQPIVLYHGQVLDGRNRLLACEKAGVKPTFSEYPDDDAGAFALVISLNTQRRDLTSAQRAIVAARAMEAMPERRGRPEKGAPKEHNNGRSRHDLAKMFKVGHRQVQEAKALLAEAPDLAEQVACCTLPIAAAYEQLQHRRQQAAQKAPELLERVRSGELALPQARPCATLARPFRSARLGKVGWRPGASRTVRDDANRHGTPRTATVRQGATRAGIKGVRRSAQFVIIGWRARRPAPISRVTVARISSGDPEGNPAWRRQMTWFGPAGWCKMFR